MKIAVLSRNANLYSTRRLIEAAQERGHTVETLNHLECYMGLKQGQPTIHHKGAIVEGFDAIIPRIGSSVTFYGTAIVRQFEMMKVFSANSSMAISQSRDKLRSLQLLAREGLGIPNTAFAHYTSDIDDLLKMVGGVPVVIKLLEGTQGIGVMLAETKKAAKAILETFHGLEKNVLVQEYIKEAKGADLRVIVIDGQIIGAMKRQAAEGEFRSNLHRGGIATMVKLTIDERKTAIRAAKIMGLSVAGVDMLQSERGPLVMEVNSSPGLEGFEAATGLDIASKVIEFIERNEYYNKV